MKKAILFVFSLVLSLSAYAQLPIKSYAQLPNISQVALSPSGKAVAYLQNYDGKLVLTVHDLKTHKKKLVLQTDNKSIALSWYDWATDDLLIFGANYTEVQRGVKYTSSRLFKYNLRDPSEKLVQINQPYRNQRLAQFQDSVISLLPQQPNKVLVQTDFDIPNKPSVYLLDLLKDRRQKLVRGRSKIASWIADQQGNVRIGYGIDGINAYYMLYDNNTKDLTELYTFQARGPEAIHILGFDKDPNIIYLTALHQGKTALFKADVTQRPMLPKLVFSDPDYDFDGSIIYSHDGRAIGFSHSNVENSRVYWDEDRKLLQRSLKAALPSYDTVIISMSADNKKYIAYGDSDQDSDTYLFGDRETKSLIGLGRLYPDITGEQYLGKYRVSFKARDGLEIEGYLTLPKQFTAAAPTIVFPHGGPYARDYAGFDYWSELLASRGFVVFQPNFRGSFGYGFDFLTEANEDWGGKMQDDLQDAANWLIKENYALKDKICIGGASYGGYAALMAVIKHPETFKCAASFAGVTDLESIVSRARFFTNKELVRDQFGQDMDKLAAQSPVNYAKQINRPILLIHGDDDKVVPVGHSRDMANELEDYDKAFKYIELEDGNHHLSYQEHRINTLTAFLEFFEQHLK
ncbi:alpha/beta hydrolase family protein [Pseudoalteromonas piscicida]|uniref:Peptidase S9 n=1 Tax=Pseudoalteromonas piscicida TaxID=43662 RepID=A0A2A5JTK8_PSEO7|nr:S9 family peptidase [Pseudoalteromonas piscicida]PCK32758.1 peptidase S9 [Pseudoalteromonas piscicida]